MKSRFTYRQSQVATAVEVLVALAIGIPAWFLDYPTFAWGALFWAALSIAVHFHRGYADD